MTVLIVDDDPDIREVIALTLAHEGYATVEAADGGEGLVALRAHRPSLVLLDLMMPRVNGWEFREQQKLDPAVASIPVVAMSAGPMGGVDADALLPKPFDLSALIESVKRLTE
jgi:CheY-like chemotaxis protein